MSKTFAEILPKCSDDELDALDRTFQRLRDGEQDKDLLQSELLGQIAILEIRHGVAQS